MITGENAARLRTIALVVALVAPALLAGCTSVTLDPAPPGMVPWIGTVPTTQRVIFITIDDGYDQDPAVPAVLKAANVKLTMFLTDNAISRYLPYFQGLAKLGSAVGSHAVTHVQLKDQPYEYQKQQLCDSRVWLGQHLGTPPTLFRPPYGQYDDNTLKAGFDCGYKVYIG
ncbi:MAG TPA: polysaccharide deacetylase family protein [Micromonosporaceae bacterium]|nr:polysaccharide deacetylase family protein [Micromonosporaceae bacterium]